MTKPTEFPEVATTNTTLPTAGTANKLEPPTAIKNTGWDQSQKPAAQHFNWLFAKINEWINYFNDKEVESGEVLLYEDTLGVVSNIDLATVFSDNTSYKYFMIVLEDAVATTGGERLALRYSIDGTTFYQTASSYRWMWTKQEPGAGGGDEITGSSTGDTMIKLGHTRTNTDVGYWWIKIADPHSGYVATTYEKTSVDISYVLKRTYGVGGPVFPQPVTGISIFWETSDTFQTGSTIKIYGSNKPF